MPSRASLCSTLITQNSISKDESSVPSSRRFRSQEPKSKDGITAEPISIDPNLTQADQLVLEYLLHNAANSDPSSKEHNQRKHDDHRGAEEELLEKLERMNDENSPDFEPTVFCTWDLKDIPARPAILRTLLNSYIQWASHVTRRPTDVVFITHLALYFTTSLPSALYLFFYNFTWLHGVSHAAMSAYYFGTYTLMRHNHIHNNGILSESWWMLDTLFPYVLDPLMGHTWNSYYYHHVKHHHVEGNGPGDLSTTLRLQRDEISSLLYYVSRFMFFIWLDLPLYFIRTGKYSHALRAAFWEFSSYMFMLLATQYSLKASAFVLLVPFSLIRLGLMIGNFGQHAFVDEVDPDSDYRSSITIIDVPSNRFCFNDGYHTAHHINSLRHWRDQPLSFIKSQDAYVRGRALVFRNIDYLEITYRLMRKDYEHLARCLVPISHEQKSMSQEEREGMLRRKTRRFSEDEIGRKFGQ
ncbi:hypothetical protein GJ744_007330 [Endocarpon pusillum]|uniref:Fatty acid desaturase domain-containing protein n=1 Tax=Endocarpon pusillum TaxID=364733 RepID=A0A8H7AKI7_9EURO|nr:hypothetical protein GJ744_007330 [Endocarpon pusillum]